MLNTTFIYLNPRTGLDTPKLDNRHIKELEEKDDEELERELDEEAEKEGKPTKKSKKEEEDDDLEDDEEEDTDEENDDDEEDDDSEEDDDTDEEEDDDEEQEKKKRQLAEEEKKKKAARESQREALVQKSRNEQLTNKIREAANVNVTDEELKAEAEKEGLDFDVLDNFQKSMLKRTIIAERKFSTVSEVVVEEDKVNEWAGKVDTWLDTAIEDVKYKRLKGHESEFRSFAMKESRRGLDFDDLARSFLFDLPEGKKKHKGSVLLRGGGGDAPKRKQLTEDDTVVMRKVSPGRLTDMMKKGKIKIDI